MCKHYKRGDEPYNLYKRHDTLNIAYPAEVSNRTNIVEVFVRQSTDENHTKRIIFVLK